MRYRPVGVDEVVRETESAFLFRVAGAEVWVPKSQIEEPGDLAEGDEDVEVGVAEWLCVREDW